MFRHPSHYKVRGFPLLTVLRFDTSVGQQELSKDLDYLVWPATLFSPTKSV